MSILNVAVMPTYALVAVDTATERVGANGTPLARYDSQKAMVFGRCVVAARGDQDLASCFFGSLLGVPWTWDIEKMHKALEVGCVNAARRVAEARAGAAAPSGAERTEIVIAGWADTYTAPRAYVATVEGDTVTVERIEYSMAAPGEGIDLPEIHNTGGMVRAAGLQVVEFSRLHPGRAIGGELIVYEIMPASITVRRMGRIG